MRIFISHQRADADIATAIGNRLYSVHRIDCYLDVIDPHLREDGDELGEYIRQQLGRCTQLMAVISENAKASWWVPWEIGVSTEKDQPIATFARDNTALPEYLKKWPYLRTYQDIDEYARISILVAQTMRKRSGWQNSAELRRAGTAEFYKRLRSSLGQ